MCPCLAVRLPLRHLHRAGSLPRMADGGDVSWLLRCCYTCGGESAAYESRGEERERQRERRRSPQWRVVTAPTHPPSPDSGCRDGCREGGVTPGGLRPHLLSRSSMKFAGFFIVIFYRRHRRRGQSEHVCESLGRGTKGVGALTLVKGAGAARDGGLLLSSVVSNETASS